MLTERYVNICALSEWVENCGDTENAECYSENCVHIKINIESFINWCISILTELSAAKVTKSNVEIIFSAKCLHFTEFLLFCICV